MPISLASQEAVRCTSCGHSGPLPPDVGIQVAAARQALGRIDLRQRQFTDAQRRSLGTTDVGLWIYVAVFAVMTFLSGAFWLVNGQGKGGLFFTLLFGLPSGVVLAMGALGLLWALRRRRDFEDRCAAQPPGIPGEPASCRVCGGPVAPATDQTGVVRCAYCAADNLVSPAALARAHGRVSVAFGDYERVTASRAVAVAGATAASGVLLIVLSALTPLVAGGIAIVAAVVSFSTGTDNGGDFDRTSEYAVVAVGGNRCIGEAHRGVDGSVDVVVSGVHQRVPASANAEVFDASWLVGKSVSVATDDGPRTCRVASVYRSRLVGTNGANLELPSGGTVSRPVDGLCLAP